MFNNNVDKLSRREFEIYNLRHLTIRETAFELDLCDSTVKYHRSNINRKLNLPQKTRLGMKYSSRVKNQTLVKFYPNNGKYYFQGRYLKFPEVIKLLKNKPLKVMNHETKEFINIEDLQTKATAQQRINYKNKRQE
jgi:DNA-binding CsgD family transcriptional regulator